MTKERFDGHRSVVQFTPKEPSLKRRIATPALKLYTKIAFRDTKPLFILGCMRSGSTLLSHILMSHPDIFGVGESHIVWRSRDSFYDVATEVIRLQRELPWRRKYLLDKILHSHLTPHLDALTSIAGTKIIVLLRRPQDNIASIGKMTQVANAGGISVACEEYCRRLEDMDCILKSLERPDCLLVEYEHLTSDPDAVLHDIQTFLQLGSPLEREYKLTRVSGRWGYGDGSDNIQAGKIVKKTARKPVHIEAETLEQADLLYDKVRETTQTLQDASSAL